MQQDEDYTVEVQVQCIDMTLKLCAKHSHVKIRPVLFCHNFNPFFIDSFSGSLVFSVISNGEQSNLIGPQVCS